MVDMRKRFRGNQPVAVSLEIEGGAGPGPGPGGERRQLYGGGAAVGELVRETGGREEEEEGGD
ncbi:hypothetical protein MMC06_003521 [Schaereria dolodes]|nr:hypothetical protein [Schaereria dolodes]